MRDAARNDGLTAFKSAVADLIVPMSPPPAAPPARPVGVHRLRGERVALGLGLPFGHSDAETLCALVEIAKRADACGLRTAPGRTLLLLELTVAAARELAVKAHSLGFIVDADDPRRNVVACAGAPVCASGEIPSRSLAPAVAQAAAPWLGAEDVVHLSGCSKGCAHPSPAAIAVFGRDGVCDIQMNGSLSGSAKAEDLPGRIARILQSRQEPERG
jgi:precorrin-3B synthase